MQAISLSLSASIYVLFQGFGTRNPDGANRNGFLSNSLSLVEDLHEPVQLQLCQPQQQNDETPIRATNLG